MNQSSASSKGPGITINAELFERAALACRRSAASLKDELSVKLAVDWNQDAVEVMQALTPAPRFAGLSLKDRTVLDLVRQEVMTQASYEHCVRTLARQGSQGRSGKDPSSPLTVAASIRGGRINDTVLQHPSWVLPFIEFHDPRGVELLANHVGCNAKLLGLLSAPDTTIQDAINAALAALAH